jgi:hypothetical protein
MSARASFKQIFRGPAAALLLLAYLIHQPLGAVPKGCSGGVFGIEAQVVLIDPAGASLMKRAPNGKQLPVNIDSFICAGDSISVPANGPVKKIVLYHGGRTVSLARGQTFTNEEGVSVYASQALEFVSNFLHELGEIKSPPDLAVDTTSRGDADASAAIRKPRFLGERLPSQRLTPAIAPIVTWKDGAAPFVCEAQSGEGATLWTVKVPDSKRSCAFTSDLTKVSRVTVHDAQAQTVTWDITPASWSDVPRPEWISSASFSGSAADRTAWAFWLWKEAGPEWRLQALSMLNELASQEFLAGYLRDNILAETAGYAPR